MAMKFFLQNYLLSFEYFRMYNYIRELYTFIFTSKCHYVKNIINRGKSSCYQHCFKYKTCLESIEQSQDVT